MLVDTSGRAAISAHRGGIEHAPAQTWGAFRSAKDMGAEYVEFDVRRCVDGVLVTYHDEVVGSGGPRIADITYGELCDRTGFDVPIVADVLALLAPRTIAHLDLKTTGYEVEAARTALEVVGSNSFVASVPDTRAAAEIRRVDPSIQTAVCLGQRARGRGRPRSRIDPGEDCSMRRIVDSGCNWIVINHWLLNGRLLRNCSARGIGVMAWTVNDPLRARDYLTDRRIGVIITDYPMRTRRIRDALDDRTTIAVARATRPEYRPMPASPR